MVYNVKNHVLLQHRRCFMHKRYAIRLNFYIEG